jgi:hypothetical protein
MSNPNEQRPYELADVDGTAESPYEHTDVDETVESLHDAGDQPRLPSGQIIDAKNTLQSFALPTGPQRANITDAAVGGKFNNYIGYDNRLVSSNKPSTVVAIEVDVLSTFVDAELVNSVELGNLDSDSNKVHQETLHTNGRFIYLMCYFLTIILVALGTGLGVYCGLGNCSSKPQSMITSAPTQFNVGKSETTALPTPGMSEPKVAPTPVATIPGMPTAVPTPEIMLAPIGGLNFTPSTIIIN